jgi:hypothetical protein
LQISEIGFSLNRPKFGGKVLKFLGKLENTKKKEGRRKALLVIKRNQRGIKEQGRKEKTKRRNKVEDEENKGGKRGKRNDWKVAHWTNSVRTVREDKRRRTEDRG